MESHLYDPIHGVAKIMTTPALIMNTKEKKDAYNKIGAAAEKSSIEQEFQQGLVVASERYKQWDKNPLSDADEKPQEVNDPVTYWVWKILVFAAGALSAYLCIILIKKLIQTHKKRG